MHKGFSEIQSKIHREIQHLSHDHPLNPSHFYLKRSYPKSILINEKIIHLIFLPDLFDYHKYYFSFPDYLLHLNSTQIISTWIDYPGMGHGTGIRKHIESIDILSKQLIEHLNVPLYQIDSEVSTYLVASGFGGLVWINCLLNFQENIKFNFKGTVLINPLLSLSQLKKTFIHRFDPLLKLFKNHQLMKYPTKIPIHISDLVSDQSIINQMLNDPLVIDELSLHSFLEIEKCIEKIKSRPFFLKGTYYYLMSNKNQLIDPSLLKLFAKGMNKDLTTIDCVESQYHMLLNDQNNKLYFQKIYQWMMNNEQKNNSSH